MGADQNSQEAIQARITAAWEAHGAESQEVRALLNHPDQFVRQWTVEVLAIVGQEATALLLVSHLTDPAPLVRIEIIEGLGRLKFQPAQDELTEILQTDADSLVRVCAAEALGELAIPTPEVAQALVRAMVHDRAPLVRAYAAESLGRLNARTVIGQVVSQLRRERNTRVRASLLAALYRLGNEAALAQLLTMLRRVRRWDMQSALLHILRDLLNDGNRVEIKDVVDELAKRNEAFRREHRWFFELLG